MRLIQISYIAAFLWRFTCHSLRLQPWPAWTGTTATSSSVSRGYIPAAFSRLSSLQMSTTMSVETMDDNARKDMWKAISNLERKAVELIVQGDEASMEEACILFAKSNSQKSKDPFMQLTSQYAEAERLNDVEECTRLMADMVKVGPPPHLKALANKQAAVLSRSSAAGLVGATGDVVDDGPEEVDPGSTFSDTVTEKIRIKVSSFYDKDKSDPKNGKYMFWYKVGIYNEGPEPVQIVARMWEIEKCKGEKEVVRGAGIMNQQPIVPPGDVYTYQSVCPLKVFPPKGRRVIGSMSGAYTMCKGNMGQHNFTAKVSKFNLILPESELVDDEVSS